MVRFLLLASLASLVPLSILCMRLNARDKAHKVALRVRDIIKDLGGRKVYSTVSGMEQDRENLQALLSRSKGCPYMVASALADVAAPNGLLALSVSSNILEARSARNGSLVYAFFWDQHLKTVFVRLFGQDMLVTFSKEFKTAPEVEAALEELFLRVLHQQQSSVEKAPDTSPEEL
jgi:hypothetical protein